MYIRTCYVSILLDYQGISFLGKFHELCAKYINHTFGKVYSTVIYVVIKSILYSNQ